MDKLVCTCPCPDERPCYEDPELICDCCFYYMEADDLPEPPELKKYVVCVSTAAGPRYLSGFQWDGDHTVPVLTDKSVAIIMCYQTAAYFVRKLSDAGFSAEAEVI